MKQFTKPKLLNHCIMMILLGATAGLSACTGGDFGVVQTPTVVPNAPTPTKDTAKETQDKKLAEESKKIIVQNQEENESLKVPATGYVLEGATRNADTQKQDVPLNMEQLKVLGDEPTLITDKLSRQPRRRDGHLITGLAHDISKDDDILPILGKDMSLVGFGNLDVLDKKGELLPPPCPPGATYCDPNLKSKHGNYGDYRYVRFGTLTDKINKRDATSPVLPLTYAFYHGSEPSASLPVANSIHYQGGWLYMSDARPKKAERDESIKRDSHEEINAKYYHDLVNFNDNLGNASNASATHVARSDIKPANNDDRLANMKAKFTVNFADKTMTGELGYEAPFGDDNQKISIQDNDDANSKKANIDKMQQPYTPLYQIEATLKNNRFSGRANSQVKQSGKRTIHHYGVDYEHTDTRADKALFATDGTVEGGFYGENAVELAGKMVSDNRDLMAVFGAKQQGDAGQAQTLFDAKKLNTPVETVVRAKDISGEGEHGLPEDIYDFAYTYEGEERQELIAKIKQDTPEIWKKLESFIPDFENVISKVFDGESEEDNYDEQGKLADKYSEFLKSLQNEERGSVLSTIETKSLSFFGDIGKLRIGNHTYHLNAESAGQIAEHLKDVSTLEIKQDGKVRKLLLAKSGETVSDYINVCCTGFDHVKFGKYQVAGSGVNYFVQGVRSQSIPQTGKAVYHGHWAGFIETVRPRNDGVISSTVAGLTGGSSQSGNAYGDSLTVKNQFFASPNDSTVKFDVDFDSKRLKGEFISGSQPIFYIDDAYIQGTGFSGTAKTKGGFTFNAQSIGAKEVVHFDKAQVQGGFYGVDGQELGGTVHYNSNDGSTGTHGETSTRVGAVFGAKRQ